MEHRRPKQGYEGRDVCGVPRHLLQGHHGSADDSGKGTRRGTCMGSANTYSKGTMEAQWFQEGRVWGAGAFSKATRGRTCAGTAELPLLSLLSGRLGS